MKKILIADDHPLFRQALQGVLSAYQATYEIEECHSLSALVAALDGVDQREVSLIFLDLHMSDSADLTGLLTIRATFPDIAIMVVSASDEARTVGLALQAGAQGYLYKSATTEEIKAATDQVLLGKRYLPSNYNESAALLSSEASNNLDRIRSLTPAQLKVFRFLYDGMMNKQIAYEMDISEATVKAHVTSIYRKLGVRTRTQAVVMAKDLDLEDGSNTPAN